VEGGGLTVSGVSRNRGGFVKCVAIQKRLGIPGTDRQIQSNRTGVPNRCVAKLKKILKLRLMMIISS
jgi:hypothetical protein